MEASTTQKNRKLNFALLKRLTRGSIGYLALGGLCLILAIAAAYIVPIVTSFTIDYVLGDKPSNLPAFIMDIIDSWGGRDFLRSHLYICALALIFFTILNGVATYFRRSCIANASETVAMTTRNALYEHLQPCRMITISMFQRAIWCSAARRTFQPCAASYPCSFLKC